MHVCACVCMHLGEASSKADIEFGVPRISGSQERVVRGGGEVGGCGGGAGGEWNIFSNR